MPGPYPCPQQPQAAVTTHHSPCQKPPPKSHIYTPSHGTGSSFKALIYSLNSLRPLKAFDPIPGIQNSQGNLTPHLIF